MGAGRPITITYWGPPTANDASLTVDGQRSVSVRVGDEITIEVAAPHLRLVPPRASVFDVLERKLGWSGPRRRAPKSERTPPTSGNSGQ
jgi:NAD kinase